MLHFNFRSGKKEKSAEEYRECAAMHMNAVKSSMGTFLQTGVVMIATVVAMIALGRAWFVSNSQVSSGAATVNAQQDVIRIASKGIRQKVEENSGLGLKDGESYEYGEDTYYYTENGEIALRLSKDYIISPGASGSIEFYIIPTRDGEMTTTLHLGLAGYSKRNSDTAKRVEDSTLDALLSGHILLFGECDNNGHYSKWLYNGGVEGIMNNSITVTLPEETKSDDPYPVKIYWIWPMRYENMVDDLYKDDTIKNNERFAQFLESETKAESMKPISETSGYYYSRIYLTKKNDNEISLNDKDSRTKAYNLADEYIGTNADYLYLTIKTAAFEDVTE